jgi:hypothetical protein
MLSECRIFGHSKLQECKRARHVIWDAPSRRDNRQSEKHSPSALALPLVCAAALAVTAHTVHALVQSQCPANARAAGANEPRRDISCGDRSPDLDAVAYLELFVLPAQPPKHLYC